ncbi:polymerase delta-interacting protein [Elysia marginata]|uniref:Polymerase delta-interacting protein n=1 Tax=Elysia marginata TaxID=1093978 RepID=A0AAV4G9N5_9GAST|nr:polymerase delta-interacting protein [Elysia marginata]
MPLNILRKLALRPFTAPQTAFVLQKSCVRCLTTRLAEVGVLEPPRDHGKAYDTGQLFLHKIFGYRGIVLFPWLAHVYDRDTNNKAEESKKVNPWHKWKPWKPVDVLSSELQKRISKTTEKPLEDHNSAVGKEVKGKNHMYYQVLIDARDCPHIRAQTEAVTFLGNQDNSRALYAIPGLDYVAHEDVLPYHSPDPVPIQHELFDKFLMHDPQRSPSFVARETLGAWQEKNHPWLQLSDVHRETTENIRVTVTPFYMGCREAQQTHVYWWRYCVRLENRGVETVQLRERHWRIFSLSGTLETVRGRGVVGQIFAELPTSTDFDVLVPE